jgi:uncharacterized membrane protein YeiH
VSVPLLATADLARLVAALDLAAIALFAATGALVASRKQMDIFGFALLGTVAGIGGGTLRDILLGELPVFWVKRPEIIVVCVVAASVTFFTAHLVQSRYRLLLWLDAVGLAVYAVLGAEKALAVGAGPVVAIVMGVVTGTFGGIIRDVLGGEVPLLLRRDIYVTAALIGAATYVGADALALATPLGWAAGVAACFLVRALALVFGWSLPVYRPRPGRSPEELARLGLWRPDDPG